jgi:hypothetical protein
MQIGAFPSHLRQASEFHYWEEYGLFAARKTPDGLDRLLTYYKASMTVAEYVIKNVKRQP